jgi:hypothetical protein
VCNLLGVFASYYHWITFDTPTALGSTERPSVVDCIYFATTTFTTTGFGDFHPTTQLARGLNTAQMGLGFCLLTFVLTLLVGGIGWATGTMARQREWTGGKKGG